MTSSPLHLTPFRYTFCVTSRHYIITHIIISLTCQAVTPYITTKPIDPRRSFAKRRSTPALAASDSIASLIRIMRFNTLNEKFIVCVYCLFRKNLICYLSFLSNMKTLHTWPAYSKFRNDLIVPNSEQIRITIIEASFLGTEIIRHCSLPMWFSKSLPAFFFMTRVMGCFLYFFCQHMLTCQALAFVRIKMLQVFKNTFKNSSTLCYVLQKIKLKRIRKNCSQHTKLKKCNENKIKMWKEMMKKRNWVKIVHVRLRPANVTWNKKRKL